MIGIILNFTFYTNILQMLIYLLVALTVSLLLVTNCNLLQIPLKLLVSSQVFLVLNDDLYLVCISVVTCLIELK